MTPTTSFERVTLTEGALVAAATVWLVFNIVNSPEPMAAALVHWNPVLLILALARPLFVCLLFIAFSLFRLHEAYPALLHLKIPLTLGALMLAALATHAIVLGNVRPKVSRELLLFAVFFAIVTVGVAFSSNRTNSMEFWSGTYWKIGLMTLAVAWLPRRSEDFALIARTMVVGGGLVGLVAIVNWTNGTGLVEGTRVTIGRDIRSVLGDPNDLCLILLFPLGFAMAMAAFKTNLVDRVLGVVCVPVLLASIVFTQSRGGLLGVMGVSAVILSRFIRSKTARIVALIFLGLALFAVMGIGGRLSGGAAELSEAGVDESMQGRFTAWRAAVAMALAHPLVGVGVLNFPNNFYSYTNVWSGKAMAVHSTWFGVLAETGFIGWAVYMAMVAICWQSSLASVARAQDHQMPSVIAVVSIGHLGALTGFVVAGSFLTQGFTWPPYILIGITAALARYTSEFNRQGRLNPHSTGAER